jgi:hypothetical protein
MLLSYDLTVMIGEERLEGEGGADHRRGQLDGGVANPAEDAHFDIEVGPLLHM